ncbi:MAG TPA: tetratricopeptide repeat protein [Blastocatellia bacterium]|nr:tetratricopeptide repeat protein [Blastocatellia bacterium]
MGPGDLGGAIADYDRLIELTAHFAEAYTNRGNARQARGEIDEPIATSPNRS